MAPVKNRGLQKQSPANNRLLDPVFFSDQCSHSSHRWMSSRQNIKLKFLDNLEIVVTKILEKDKDLMEAKAEDELKRSSPTVFQRLWSWLVYLENSKTKCGRLPSSYCWLKESTNFFAQVVGIIR